MITIALSREQEGKVKMKVNHAIPRYLLTLNDICTESQEHSRYLKVRGNSCSLSFSCWNFCLFVSRTDLHFATQVNCSHFNSSLKFILILANQFIYSHLNPSYKP